MLPELLLHICCANCGIVPIELLKEQFDLTLFWFNPNIHPKKEYKKRLTDVKRLATIYKVRLLKQRYDTGQWFKLTGGLEKEAEGGKRCEQCFQMRLEKTARFARKRNFDYFATTLTSGSQKKAEIINYLGKELAKKYDLKFFSADFKKQGGFQKGLELSKKYNFYRQNYCGCAFSKKSKCKNQNVK